MVAVARTVGGLEELDDAIRAKGGSATLVPLDLKDYPAIDRLGAAIYERWGKLDMLLGNAGLPGVVTPLSHLEPKVFEEVMAVNVTANWRLIRSLDPLLRQSDAGRALFVTSDEAERRRPFWGIYSASKAALAGAGPDLCRRAPRHKGGGKPHRSRTASHPAAGAGAAR